MFTLVAVQNFPQLGLDIEEVVVKQWLLLFKEVAVTSRNGSLKCKRLCEIGVLLHRKTARFYPLILRFWLTKRDSGISFIPKPRYASFILESELLVVLCMAFFEKNILKWIIYPAFFLACDLAFQTSCFLPLSSFRSKLLFKTLWGNMENNLLNFHIYSSMFLFPFSSFFWSSSS